MKSFQECSDMPYFEDEFKPPLEKKTYVLNKCMVSPDDLPSHVEAGTYKVVVNGYGDVEWHIETVFEVISNF